MSTPSTEIALQLHLMALRNTIPDMLRGMSEYLRNNNIENIAEALSLEALEMDRIDREGTPNALPAVSKAKQIDYDGVRKDLDALQASAQKAIRAVLDSTEKELTVHQRDSLLNYSEVIEMRFRRSEEYFATEPVSVYMEWVESTQEACNMACDFIEYLANG